jgi:hypothetical protein
LEEVELFDSACNVLVFGGEILSGFLKNMYIFESVKSRGLFEQIGAKLLLIF